MLNLLSVSAPQDSAPFSSAPKIHVLHIVRNGRAEGGMENGIVNVANRLPRERYRISVCALDSTETFSRRINRSDSEYYLVPNQEQGIDWGLVFRLRKLLIKVKPHLVHSHNWGTFLYAVLASHLARIPIIHGEHGKNPNEMAREKAAKSLAKSILGRTVKRVVTVSRSIAEEWVSYGVSPNHIRCIPNGVDTERFRPRGGSKREKRLSFGLPDSCVLIGSIGRLDKLKDYETLVAAFAEFRKRSHNAHLALLGSGPEECALRTLATQLGVADCVSFLGFRSNPEEFLNALDIFALPSKYEGMSNVVLEAMASGIPVICADLPSHREVLLSGVEGFLISPCTPTTLSATFQTIACDSETAAKVTTAARKRVVEQFGLDRMALEYASLYALGCGG